MTKKFGRNTVVLIGSAGLFAVPLLVPAKPTQEPSARQGKALFAKSCAPCHGEAGKGGPGFKNPLRGNLSVAQLGKFIHTSMPPGNKKATVSDSVKIAAYMHAEFYSPIAQARNEPARVQLSRLTVKQFRNSVADLVRNFQPALPWDSKPGFRAEYFAGRERNDKSRLIQRNDPQVKFDFGTNAPGPTGFDARNFQIAWQGSVFAPDTGDYEFVVRSDQAVRLFLNHESTPLVDGWVRSDADREFRGAVTLLGGRSYNVYLEFSKATPGVDDSEKKAKLPVKPAFVELCWKRPKMAEEVIPARFIYSGWSAPVYVAKTAFPADDRSIGYERGVSVDKEWDEATTSAALDAAGYVAANIDDLAETKEDASDRAEKVKKFCRQFVLRAFRRPLTPELARMYVDRRFEGTNDLRAATKKVVLLALKSPRFLYREVGDPSDPYAVAAHLSFGLWDTLPDPQLMEAAANGELSKADGIRRQAERLANNQRAWNKMRDYYLWWLKVGETPDIVKSAKTYPQFTPQVASKLRESLELFLETNGWGPEGSYSKLMTAPEQFMDGELAKIYGAKAPLGDNMQPIKLDAGKRVGVLGSPYVLSRFAYLEGSSPIHRGVLIVRNMLGRTLNPPPVAVAPLAASLKPDLTTRQRVALQTKNEPCNGCHSLINPIGFTLEEFDAIGRFRAADNGKPVDPSGSYKSSAGEAVTFKNAIDLSNYLTQSQEAHNAFVEKLFHHLVKQPVLAYGTDTLPKLRTDFEGNGMKIRDLMVDIVTTTARTGAPKN